MARMKQFHTHSYWQSQLLLSKIISAKIKSSLQIVQNHTQNLCWYQPAVCNLYVQWTAEHVGELVGMREGPEVLSHQLWKWCVSALLNDAWGCWTWLAPVPGVGPRGLSLPALLLSSSSSSFFSFSHPPEPQVTKEPVWLQDEIGGCEGGPDARTQA